MIEIPYTVMLDVMEFVLENTFVKMPTGELRKQEEGIPMGDPLSPALSLIHI